MVKILPFFNLPLHAELNAFLKNYGMAPSKINSGAKIQNKFSQQQIQKVLTDFYKGAGAKYKEASDDFFKYIEGL